MSGRRGRRNRSKHFSEPINPNQVVPLRMLHPLRAGRAGEAFLVCCLIANVHAEWLTETAEPDEEEMEALLNVVLRVQPGLIDVLTDDTPADGFQGLVPTILWAATRWACSISLPSTEDELWSGPPLSERLTFRAPISTAL